MAWMWWLLAPVASTALGAIVIWWRTPAETAHRLRRADAISEHQALLRALGQEPPSSAGQPGTSHAIGTSQVTSASQVVIAERSRPLTDPAHSHN